MSHDIQMYDIAQTKNNQDAIDNTLIVNIDQLKGYLLVNNIVNSYLSSSPGSYSNFIVNLPEGKFKVTRILRILPNRRIVFQAHSLGCDIDVVIKLFVNTKKYNKDYDLLLKNHELLIRNRLLTPKILSSTKDEANELAYVIFEFIKSDALSAELSHHNKLFIAAIAKLHKKYIYQQDLHLNNFIVSNKKVYYLDVESLFTKTGYLVNKQALDNFAMFLAQLDMTYCEQWYDYIDDYLSCLIPNITSANGKNILKTVKYIHKKAHKLLDQRLKNYLIKTQTENTQFKVIHDSFISVNNKKYKIDGVTKRSYYAWLDLFIENPDQFIAKHQLAILKQGNTAHVYLVEYQGHKFVIKQYLKKSFLHQVAATFKAMIKRPRAINSWCYANLLEHVNIETPSPLGCFLTKRYGLIQDSYYIMKFDEDFTSLANLHKEQVNPAYPDEEVVSKIEKLLYKLNFLKIAHRDFKNNNLAVIDSKAEQLTVIDMDSMQRYKTKLFFRSQHNKDINRILRCYNDNPEFSALLKSRLTDEINEL